MNRGAWWAKVHGVTKIRTRLSDKTTIYQFIHTLSIQEYHMFFISPSVDGYLGCFQILAVLSNATMNTGMHVSFSISIYVSFFSDIYPGVELLGHIVVLFLVFLKKLFCTVVTLTYTSNNSLWSFPFSTFCQHLLFVFFLMIVVLTGMRWYLMISQYLNDTEHLLMCNFFFP